MISGAGHPPSSDSAGSLLHGKQVSEEEREWALAIKHAAHGDPDIDADQLSDLEYLHHAFVAKGKVSKAIERIKRLSRFKNLYGIKEYPTVEEAMRDLTKYQQRMPGLFLSIGVLPDDQQMVVFCDFSKFLTKNFATKESVNVGIRGLYQFCQALQPNIAAMRAGISLVLDSGETTWHNFSPKWYRTFSELYLHAYPMRINRFVLLNANFWMRLLRKIVSLFESKKIRERHVLPDEARQIYLQCSSYTPDMLPVEWGGTIDFQTFQRNLRQSLSERNTLEATFKL